MGKFIDLTGQRFGYLTVLKRAPNKGKQTYWECQCDCGVIKEIRGSHLKSGKIISCGCVGKSHLNSAIDITGQKFNRLTALYVVGKKKNTQTNLWECQCDCGNLTTATVSQLKSGAKQSCGCLNKEIIAQIGRNAKKDITNQRFGLLIALYPTDQRKSRSIVWHCKCDCGKEYDVSGVLLRNGEVTSCGCKLRSNGEQIIFNLLINKNINFEEQKSFNTCYNPKTKKLLYFDFYINNKYLLEFDGEQHFKSSTGWNTPENLKLVQERDQLKNQWCKDNNIPLIRIPYWHLQDLCIEDLLLETSEFIVK